MSTELVEVLGAKVHGILVTEAELHYRGSLTLDEAIMEAAGWFEYEKVLIVNNNNGERLETYLIKGARNSGVCCLNGAAAHKGKKGDELIVMTFVMTDRAAAAQRKPIRVFIDAANNNSIESIARD